MQGKGSFILAQFTSNIDPSVAACGEQRATFLYVMSPEEIQDKNRVEQAYEALESSAFKMFPRMKESILWKRRITMDVVDGVLPTPLQSREKRIGSAPSRGYTSPAIATTVREEEATSPFFQPNDVPKQSRTSKMPVCVHWRKSQKLTTRSSSRKSYTKRFKSPASYW